ncbi:hypothetical protein VQ02_13970 [Methylobacterium variabile]|jgi:cytochrome oxidase Cu insertion factor (SCO1/SenC/PrrC family)|uniref:Thioredoxin domain-containing protein n=1 Tax=Methylobacterium variabile TaxID=298794 RepID=A0A0J6SUJ0_9HYPH|nr:hypothetical protein [Methylobacterium variabile]KMO37197.1 hypothetical protein VQ02_13970 [Methylobacterium variabile]
MWPALKYITALAVSLPLWGILSTASVETQRSGAAEPRTDLEELLWPEAGGARRIDQRGAALSPAALRDKVAVAWFVAPDCAITCVARTLDLDRVAKALPDAVRTRAVFLAISLPDARGETGRLRAFADGTVGAGTTLRFLAGDAAWTASLAAMLRYPAASLPEPPPQVLLFDRRGAIAMTYGGDLVDRPRLEGDIALLHSFAQGLEAPPRRATEATPHPL